METTNQYPLRVLLADDDEDDRTFFRDALEELEFKTSLQTVTDGIALTHVLGIQAAAPPHIIFLDLNMPRKSGKECLSDIRSFRFLDKTPVVIFSTSASHRDVEETFHRGANLYIQKPSGFNLMVNVLDKVLRMDWEEKMRRADRQAFIFS